MAETKPDSMIQPEQEIGSTSSVSADLDTAPSAELKGNMIQSEQNVGNSSSMKTDLDTTPWERNLPPKLEDNMTLPEQNGWSPSLIRSDFGIGKSRLGDIANQVAERDYIKKVIIPQAVMSFYLNKLDSPLSAVFSLSDRLGRMIDKHPHLLMEVSPRYNRTYLHIAVAANSELQVRKILDRITDANSNIDHASKVVQYLSTEEKVCGYTAYQVACAIGNNDIKRMINNRLLESKKDFGISSSMSDHSVEARDEEPIKVEVVHPKLQLKRNLQTMNTLVPIEAIGVVLESHLKPLAFSDTLLKNMSLGDEFRLHTSLIVGDSDQSIKRWIKYDKAEKNGPVAKLLRNIVAELAEKTLLTTFLKLRDKAGRTILHYLADFQVSRTTEREEDKMRDLIFTTLIDELISFAPDSVDINVRDHVGRTPLHLAAAQGFVTRVDYFAEKFEEIDLNATYDMPSFGVDRDGNPEMTVKKISPLILAVQKNRTKVVQSLLTIGNERSLDVTLRIEKEIRRRGHSLRVWWTPLQLAAYLGDIETLQLLLVDVRVKDSHPDPLPQNFNVMSTLPVLHLAVFGSHPHVVRALLNCKKIDPNSQDSKKKTALYYACRHFKYEDVQGLWDKVTISQNIDPSIYGRSTKFQNSSAVMGCIDLLLQAGLDPDQSNVHNQICHYANSEDIYKWWYEKVPRELQEEKNNINAATNAISVTAALVAATSFMGPLQPPLGLSNSSDPENLWLLGYTQVDHPAVEVFLFFDSLSFYFAIASIMLALIPSLPVQQETLLHGVEKSRQFLQGAVVLLFASIVFLLCTFSAASVVIIPEGKWKHQALTIFTTILGGLICFVALILFLKRLWDLTRPRK